MLVTGLVPRNWLRLNPASKEEITHAYLAPEGLGTFHVWVLNPLPGVRFECFGVFTEFVPNKRIVDKWSMALEGSETYLFDSEGTGTRLTLKRQRRSIWRSRLLGKLVDQVEGRESERALERLRGLMESTGGPATATATS